MTDYIATRWYRAPEILLGTSNYGKPVDIWSLGCVIAELYMNQPIFPGTSTLNQITKILLVTGIPDEKSLIELGSPLSYNMMKTLYIKEHAKSLETMLDTDD